MDKLKITFGILTMKHKFFPNDFFTIYDLHSGNESDPLSQHHRIMNI